MKPKIKSSMVNRAAKWAQNREGDRAFALKGLQHELHRRVSISYFKGILHGALATSGLALIGMAIYYYIITQSTI